MASGEVRQVKIDKPSDVAKANNPKFFYCPRCNRNMVSYPRVVRNEPAGNMETQTLCGVCFWPIYVTISPL